MRWALIAALALSGCGALSGDSGPIRPGALRGVQQEIDGIRFRPRVTAPAEDRRRFTVTTSGAARGVPQAAEAGRVEAIRYCLTRFGGSNIEWTAGPDRPAEQLALTNGALVMTGRCLSR